MNDKDLLCCPVPLMIDTSTGFLRELCGLCEKKMATLFKEILKKR
jgi:hypothetical protein